jgi:sialic acid synthase SpsE
MVSTGMISSEQIIKSKWYKEADVLMHCISLYPAKISQVNLAWMRNKNYNGYSSHEIGGKAIKEMKRIINEINEVEIILGDGKRNITEDEIKLGKYYRSF